MAEEEDSVTSLKKIRGTDPDLKIILHYNTIENDGTGGSRQVEITKEYEHYGLFLSSVCGFIETALCIEMKEKENRVIHMHCSSPAIFEEALGYVLNPIQNRRKIQRMNVRTAMNLLPFYNMYDFASGRALCDDAIAREFAVLDESDTSYGFEDCWQTWIEDDSQQNTLCLLLEATVMADEMQLATAGPITARYVIRHLRQFSDQYYLEHLQTLHPMLIKGHFLHVVNPATFSPPQIEADSFPLLFLTVLSVPCKGCWSRRIKSPRTPVMVEGAGSHMEWINGLYTLSEGPLGSTADRTYVRTLDSGAKLYLRCSASPNPMWCLFDFNLGVQRIFYAARQPSEVRCEDCHAFPPVGSDTTWSAANNLYRPVPVFSFPE
jgi:hypothetical protein